MVQLLAISLLISTFATVITSKPFSSSQLQCKDATPGTDVAQVYPNGVNSPPRLEIKALSGQSSREHNPQATAIHPTFNTYPQSLLPRQRPNEIFAEIARMMRDPFHDITSLAVTSGITISLLFYISKFLLAIRTTFSHQPPQSRFDMKLGDLKASFRRPSKEPIPWDSVENVLRNLARGVDRGFIGLSRVVFGRDDIESGADITVGEQGVFFVLSVGTVVLLLMLPDERGNFVR